MESKFHTFAQPIQSIPLPERFTYPFHYTPHPLCVIAAEETQAYLKERTEWREELQTGKIVRRIGGSYSRRRGRLSGRVLR